MHTIIYVTIIIRLSLCSNNILKTCLNLVVCFLLQNYSLLHNFLLPPFPSLSPFYSYFLIPFPFSVMLSLCSLGWPQSQDLTAFTSQSAGILSLHFWVQIRKVLFIGIRLLHMIYFYCGFPTPDSIQKYS